ncbi:MAG: hypothetical protein C6I01_01835 [Epsilonproteobacteria bacterium]|nr:hypothetical protein [Campylobacterota bacterium]
MKVELLGSIEELFKALDRLITTAPLTKKVTLEVWNLVRKKIVRHYRTGIMYRNVLYRIKKEAGIVWIDDSNMLVDWKGKKINYANFVVYGSKPHKITPKRKKVLRFTSLDRWVFTRVVNHPGYKGDNFLEESVKEVLKKVDNMYKEV